MTNLIKQVGGIERARKIVMYAPEGCNFLELYPLGPRFYVSDIGLNRAINLNDLLQAIADHDRTDTCVDIKNHLSPSTEVIER